MSKKKKGATIFEGRIEKAGFKPEKDEFLEPEEHDDTHEDQEIKLHAGEKEEDVYSEEGREELLEGDEISELEEAFSEGAEEKGELGICEHCGRPLEQLAGKVVEREIKGELRWFCSSACASKCEARHKKK